MQGQADAGATRWSDSHPGCAQETGVLPSGQVKNRRMPLSARNCPGPARAGRKTHETRVPSNEGAPTLCCTRSAAPLYSSCSAEVLYWSRRPPVTVEVSCPPVGRHGGQRPIGDRQFLWQVAIWSEPPTSRLPQVSRAMSSRAGFRHVSDMTLVGSKGGEGASTRAKYRCHRHGTISTTTTNLHDGCARPSVPGARV